MPVSWYIRPVNFLQRLNITLLVAYYALFTPGPGVAETGVAAVAGREVGDPQPVTPAAIRDVLAHLARWVRHDGTMEITFPGCLAPAAPCLLFRLKRTGFSSCRASVSAAGLRLTAIR